MTVQRFDSGGKLGKVERTPQGGIKAPAGLTRSGVLVYLNPDGTERREYRPPEEVFAAQSVATLSHAPVTKLHPFGNGGQTLVTKDNFRDYSIGHLAGEARQDGDTLAGDLVIQDGDAIARIEREELNEVSLGYLCAYEPKPGTTPKGERYDGIQRNIVYNHIALVPRGRAGSEIRLRLDSAGNQECPEGQKENQPTMKIEIINGVEYEVGTPAHTKARADQATARADADERLAKAEAERDQYKADLDAAKGRFDAAVSERVALEQLATSRKVDIKGKSNEDARKAVLSALSPSLRLDDKDDTYVRAALDIALQSGNLVESVTRATHDAAPETASAIPPDVLARQNMIRRINGYPEMS